MLFRRFSKRRDFRSPICLPRNALPSLYSLWSGDWEWVHLHLLYLSIEQGGRENFEFRPTDAFPVSGAKNFFFGEERKIVASHRPVFSMNFMAGWRKSAFCLSNLTHIQGLICENCRLILLQNVPTFTLGQKMLEKSFEVNLSCWYETGAHFNYPDFVTGWSSSE